MCSSSNAERPSALSPSSFSLPSPLERLRDPRLGSAGVEIYVKRDDLINPSIPGNKWRKLKNNLADAMDQGFTTLLTFGGAYSNHLYATAAAGELFGLRTVGVVRGEQHLPLNHILRFATERGMEIIYLDRNTYRMKHEPLVIDELRREVGPFYVVPEGGANCLGLRGCMDVIDEIDVPFDEIAVPCGTGTTLAGLSVPLASHQRALGFAVLKNAAFLRTDVRTMQAECGVEENNWTINLDYHFGGFAKTPANLLAFCREFEQTHSMPCDPIYVGKMMYGLLDLASKGQLPAGSTIIALHTGGVPTS